MKKEIKALTILFISAALGITAMVWAQGPSGQSGNSNVGHLYLNEKNPETWQIVEGGAWGKMRYFLSGDEFDCVFNAKGLESGVDYTLIYYPDPWPGNGLMCLGSDTAKGGNADVKAQTDTGDLPAPYDENYPDGAKIWLVLSSDVDCANQVMTGWHPEEYLFEYQTITFDDTNTDWPTFECTPGETTACDTGLFGVCAAGTKTCTQDGFWGDCVQNQESETEDSSHFNCSDGLDNDCDGITDECGGPNPN